MILRWSQSNIAGPVTRPAVPLGTLSVQLTPSGALGRLAIREKFPVGLPNRRPRSWAQISSHGRSRAPPRGGAARSRWRWPEGPCCHQGEQGWHPPCRQASPSAAPCPDPGHDSCHPAPRCSHRMHGKRSLPVRSAHRASAQCRGERRAVAGEDEGNRQEVELGAAGKLIIGVVGGVIACDDEQRIRKAP